MKVWDADTGKEVLTLQGHKGGVTTVAFSPDGGRLFSVGWDRVVRAWEATPLEDAPVATAQRRAGNEERRQTERAAGREHEQLGARGKMEFIMAAIMAPRVLDGSKIDGTATVSTSWNGNKAYPRGGHYRLELGSNPKQTITVYVDETPTPSFTSMGTHR